MKKLSLIVSLVIVGLWAHAAMGQYSGGPRTAAATRSVLKQADQVEWADYRAGTIAGPGISGCPDAHVTCPTGVCYGYDNCCCRPHLLCCLKKIGRMLDCLLPCHKCCPNECVFGVCRPHLFDCGHCGGCGGHGMGCGAPSCSTPMDYPGASDPFIDDPIPPRPMPEPTKDVRLRPAPPMTPSPAPSPYATRRTSPYKVTTTRELARQNEIEAGRSAVAPVAAPLTTPYNPRDKFAAQPQSPAPRTDSRPGPQLILQPAAAEEEVSEEEATAQPQSRDEAPALPALLPVAIRRASAQQPVNDPEIPVNPLRK
jgi:hypothetical protein